MENDEEIKLKGRIYPGITNSAANRSKLIIGLALYYGFILSEQNIVSGPNKIIYTTIVSILFTALEIHNCINYNKLREEQIKIERSDKNILSMETLFLIMFIPIVWVSCFIIILINC